MELSKRCAVPFFINIENFARKHDAQQVLLIMDTAYVRGNFSHLIRSLLTSK
jgi:hypothetical protein